MKSFSKPPFDRLSSQEHRQVIAPAFGLILVIVIGLFILGLSPGISRQTRQTYLGASFLFGLYSWVLFRYALPKIRKGGLLLWLILGGHAIVLPIIAVFLPDIGLLFMAILGPITALLVVILVGRFASHAFIIINQIALLLLLSVHGPGIPPHYFTAVIIPLFSIVFVEVTFRIGQILNREIAHLEALNHVARQVGSTIEPKQVIELLSNTIREALSADTYYIGIQQNGVLRLEVLYDNGTFFPPQDISSENSVTALVMQRRQSLLLNDVPAELSRMGMQAQSIGEERISLSWMGTPMIASDRVIGVVAVGGYRYNAFTIHDLKLLENIAQQATLALDNAFHHAEVEEQSRCDSLTGVYNHGYFLLALGEQMRLAQEKGESLSLIMLDIDFFKSYNDTYGHLVGDQVLIRFSDIIRRHIKSIDLIGRWGGEEFAVALPGATGEQATQVAKRISESLRTLQMQDRDGKPVSPPTISQGIAVFPYEANDVYELVDLADQRLYKAKANGRDQIYPPKSHWKYIKTDNGLPGFGNLSTDIADEAD